MSNRSAVGAWCVVALLGGLVVSCTASGATGVASSSLIHDAVHGDGTVGFHFLPPMVAQPVVGPVLASELLDALAVEIVELGPDAHTIATFTSTTGSGSEVLRVDPTIPAFVVNWHTRDFALDASRTYRIRVLSDGEELGFADVDVVTSGNQLRNVDTSEFIPLRDGRTLPIVFHVEGTGLPVGPEGGELEFEGGSVVLSFPPGAVGSDIAVSATPVEPPVGLGGPVAVPGTAYEFLPSPYFFDAPVTLSIRYPAGDPSFLRLVKLVDGGSEPVESSRVDLANHAIVGEVTSFSFYAIESMCPRPPYLDMKLDFVPDLDDPAVLYPYTLGTVRVVDAGDVLYPPGFPGAPCACAPSFGNCDEVPANGCEVNLSIGVDLATTATAACGTCDNFCLAGTHCDAGACVAD